MSNDVTIFPNYQKYLNKEVIKKILISILIVFLPINDMFRNTFIKDIEIFNISIIEIGNILIIFSVFFLSIKEMNKKQWLFTIIYFLIVGIYIFLHYINLINFDKNILMNTNFNFFVETYYIFRVYILPILFIELLLVNKKIFNFEYFLKMVKILILIISGSIVLLNILRLSFGSYIYDNTIVKYNLFDYFFYINLDKNYATRGWFYSANEISLILLMLLPLNVYNLYKEKSLKSSCLLLLQMVSMVIVGTRTSSIGAVLGTIGIFGSYLFLSLLDKEQFNKKFSILYVSMVSITIIIFLFSPAIKRYFNIHTFFAEKMASIYIPNNENNYSQPPKDYVEQPKVDINDFLNKLDILILKDNKTDIINFLYSNRWTFGVDDIFVKIYPIENDLDFYLQISKNDRNINNDYRKLKIAILNRIFIRNKNIGDKLFGIGYTSNFMDVERDYAYQYYLFGIFGLILFLMPYFILYFKDIYCIFKEKKVLLKFTTFLVVIPSMLGFIVAYLSGHLFGYTTPMFVLAICLLTLNTLKPIKKVKNNIMVLQNADSSGGVFQVNNSLIEYYKKDYNFTVCTIRKSTDERGFFSSDIHHYILNNKDKWDLILGKDIKEKIKHGKIIEAFLLLLKRIIYKIKLQLDYSKLQILIQNIRPNTIVCSHYEILKAIPDEFLKNTYTEQHMSLIQTLKNKDNFTTLTKYNDKIGGIIWLSKNTCDQAKKIGLINSIYIYNPVRIKSHQSNLKNRNCVFVGRFDKIKRIDLLIDIFIRTIEKYKIKDWKLLIYGHGSLDDNIINLIEKKDYIELCGKTNNVVEVFNNASINLNTSLNEGFPMTILEGYACGIPTISFNFGETIEEIIINNKTGIVCENENDYIEKLGELMQNNKLRRKLSDGAYNYHKKFDLDVVMPKWLAIFEKKYED